MTAHLQLVRPNNVNRSVRPRRPTPTRPSNRELRPREYLTPSEVETVIRTARHGRYGHRDATLILVAYRHGLRAVELCDLEWSQVEFDRTATLHVRRAKNGKPAAHPIRGDELRALRELKRQTKGGYVFETERGTPFTTDAVNRLVKNAARVLIEYEEPKLSAVAVGHMDGTSFAAALERCLARSAATYAPKPALLPAPPEQHPASELKGNFPMRRRSH